MGAVDAVLEQPLHVVTLPRSASGILKQLEYKSDIPVASYPVNQKI
ncbi:MAG: hypothetical protein LBJ67_06085 [Planctomycetaceae bacterium]|jgi:hypothetical protein|nr:hypothetical protein [Planctomycetaceae bacterium]